MATFVVMVAQAAPALAMTAQDSSGLPGQQVTVLLSNQQANPAFTYWQVTAPANTSIANAQGNQGGGLSPFSCTFTASSAQCGPSGNGGWGAGNTVTLTLVISPAAPAGSYTGSTSLPNESANFTVTVLPPPAPTVDSPAPGTQTLDPQPQLSGSKLAGHSLQVVLDGQTVCSVPADAATLWSCTPPAPLAPGPHTASAVQTSPGGSPSPASNTLAFEVLEPAQLLPGISGPDTIIPGRTIAHELSFSNNGPGTARGVTAGASSPDFLLTECALAGAPVPCASLSGGTLSLGDLAPGATATVSVQLTLPVDRLPGSTATLTATASSVNEASSPVAATTSLNVIALPPPVIVAPAQGSTSTERQPVVSGTGDLLSTVAVSVTGQVICAAAPVDASGAWSCPVAGPLPVGTVNVTASQTDSNGLSSAAAESSFVVDIAPPAISSPQGGSQTRERRPAITGTSGYPGANIAVTSAPGGQLCTTTVAPDGTWSCTPTADLPIGSVRLAATQSLNGLTSPASPTVGFMVLAPVVTIPVVPKPTTPAPAPAPVPSPAAPVAPAPAPAPVPAPLPLLVPPVDQPPAVTPTPSPSPPKPGTPTPLPAAAKGNDPLRMDMRFSSGTIIPGEATRMMATLGPNLTASSVTVLVNGTVNKGMIYRSVTADPAGECVVATRSFSCTIVLGPGQGTELTIRLIADKLNAPASANQQLTVSSSNAAQNNSMTVTAKVLGLSEAAGLAAQISAFPGPLIPLIALFLLALAATETERRKSGRPAMQARPFKRRTSSQ